MLAGTSTLGITFGYGFETTDGEKPTIFTKLNRINNIGGINVENEQIDASATDDMEDRFIRGRGSTGGAFSVDVNFTPETSEEWGTLISQYNETGKRIWFETIIPGFDEAFFVVAQPPSKIPQPEIGQNELLVVTMSLTIEEYVGFDSMVAFTEAEA